VAINVVIPSASRNSLAGLEGPLQRGERREKRGREEGGRKKHE